MLADPEVDLVVLCVPPNTHFDFTRKALEAGKHVLVEKPFVPTAGEAEELGRLAARRNRLVCVYQNRRWDADFVTVQKLLREGALGRVYEFETHFDRYRADKPTTWKGTLRMDQANGALYDLGSHLLDQAYTLFGLPSAVSAHFVDQREGRLVKGSGPADDEPDSFNAVLSYEARGLLVHVRVGVMSVEKRQPRFWVRGTKGTYRKAGLDPQEDQLRRGMALPDPAFGKEDAAWDGTLCTLQADGSVREEPCPNAEPLQTYVKFYELLGEALASGDEEKIPVRVSQAADVLRIIEAVRKAAGEGTVVRLS